MEHAQNGHFLPVFDRAQEHKTDTFPRWGAPYMVHSAQINPSILIGSHLYVQHSLLLIEWCAR